MFKRSILFASLLALSPLSLAKDCMAITNTVAAYYSNYTGAMSDNDNAEINSFVFNGDYMSVAITNDRGAITEIVGKYPVQIIGNDMMKAGGWVFDIADWPDYTGFVNVSFHSNKFGKFGIGELGKVDCEVLSVGNMLFKKW